ncbi:NADH-quinone oxidoreductase subunit B family protein [Facilibium subflavum]|uniref:NADH-quinone oxidoreductase subunit B family protein n=1 Tax=Facilibium subflavum TaxID=2219058 RepID=UPI000E655A06|nr:sulfhydrogenase subunit delta [Facilibium subflavum]
MSHDKLACLPEKPTLAVHKFSSCDGCQLAFINDGLSLLELSQLVDIKHFAEAGPVDEDAHVDIAIIEGSINTWHDVHRIQKIRQNSHYLIAMGACATSGGIQALRNNINAQTFDKWVKDIYPQHTDVVREGELETAKPIQDYVDVDFEIRGCPVSSQQMFAAVRQLLFKVEPEKEINPVCVSCKHRGISCVMVAHNEPCLGPVTADGCNALCPAINRGCYGCYGPAKFANFDAMTTKLRQMGFTDEQIRHKYHFINNQQNGFKAAGDKQ